MYVLYMMSGMWHSDQGANDEGESDDTSLTKIIKPFRFTFTCSGLAKQTYIHTKSTFEIGSYSGSSRNRIQEKDKFIKSQLIFLLSLTNREKVICLLLDPK